MLVSHLSSSGLEGVIDDLKNGRVTLRRRQLTNKSNHPVPLETPENKDLSDIFKLLENNKKQNRISKKMIENELLTKFKKFNIIDI